MTQRIIKFRAWDKKDKVMRIVYGVSFKRVSNKGNRGEDMVEMHCTDYEDQRAIILSHFERPASEVELMQFTGLHDKNGKEIYEGDIVSGIGELNWIVKFVDQEIVPSNLHKWEVVGNIYEHEHLLKG